MLLALPDLQPFGQLRSIQPTLVVGLSSGCWIERGRGVVSAAGPHQ